MKLRILVMVIIAVTNSVSAFAKTTESNCEDGATNKIEIVICLQNQRDDMMKNQLQQLKKIFTKKQMKSANKQLDTSQRGWMLDREAICDLMSEVVKSKLKKPIQGGGNYLGDLIAYGESINDVGNECWGQMTDERNETLGELIKAMK